MVRSEHLPVLGVAAAAIFLGHLGLLLLPSELGGLPSPLLVIGAAAGAVAAAIRYL
jgi:hypothetical protein